MNGNELCSSDLLAEKLKHLLSMLQIARRTLDSNEGCIYLNEVSDMMGAAGIMTQECEVLRRQIDAELYQQNSKYFNYFNQSQ
ncbi:hypothetical protein EB927_18935 [Salmonella enterica]|nr:hypothetical protein [Salmonella enterica]EBV8483292.1 hypothetical protein [Salmonella enterica subsp. enterica serovar Ago]ECH9216108.1 hypothetical protein [Salmonella enterica subsp. enterica]ECY6191124.1 hypothetical protein [Salmonella enterica subsp. enterica serovar Anatum]EDR2604847.1 hypothetical protein [Salmonella enterica subsp. enterica]